MGRYEDFRWVTSRALDFALASLGVSLPPWPADAAMAGAGAGAAGESSVMIPAT
jgi:hypothetical protein